ncbi:MAG: sporulation integral membrane protein YtvI [Clostridiales bacterium]|nr:sporulation integral membrane protein YtvI [Clostridiales bacterium]
MSEERKAAERLLLRLLGLALAYAALRWVVPEIWDKLSPFIIAIPIAAALQPVIRFLQKKIRMKRSPAALIPVLLLLFVFLGLLIWLFTIGIGQATRIVNHSGDMVTETINSVREAMNNLLTSIGASTSPGVEQWIRDAITDATERLRQWGTGFAEQLVTFSISLATAMPYCIIYISFLTIGLYFISKNYEEIRSYLPGGMRRKQDSTTTKLTNSTLRSLFGYLRVQGTFGLMVWIISWIYLTVFGFPYAGIIALCCGIMELVPMIGSGVPFIVMAVIQFLLGNTRFGILLLVLTAALQVLRRVLEPKLMSDRIGITPLQSLIGMFVGLRYGGILGLIGGPVLMSVLVGAFKGGLFASTFRDCHVISAWMKNRLK